MLNIYLTFMFLFISVLSLWIPTKNKIMPWSILLFITLIISVASGVSNILAISSILVFYGLVFSYSKVRKIHKNILWLLICALGLGLELHAIPGFHNLLILDKVQFTSDALPFTLYLNLDKTIVGLIIVGFTLPRIDSYNSWKEMLKQVTLKLPFVLLIIMILSFIFGYVRFEPKLPKELWIWIVSNLFFTCLAEEGLFRGFFQEFLSSFKYKYCEYVAIFIPAIVFGLIHYPGGVKYVILATVAGILYGWIYKVTRRIEASIVAHFVLNLTHILFFTYPALLNKY